jgi:hypothetical protein
MESNLFASKLTQDSIDGPDLLIGYSHQKGTFSSYCCSLQLHRRRMTLGDLLYLQTGPGVTGTEQLSGI